MILQTISNASVLFMVFLASASPLGSLRLHVQQPKGVVKGKVIGVNSDAGVPNVRIVIDSQATKREAVTDNSGSYEVELPADVYSVTVSVSGYYPYRRAPFRVRTGMTAIINLSLFLLPDEWTKRYYERLAIPGTVDEKLDVLLDYESRKEHDDFVEYGRATLYYDGLAVSALDLRLDKKEFRFTATGNVAVDDGQRSVYVRQADIHFAGSSPQVELTFGAVDFVSGKGSIDGDKVEFDFRIERGRVGQFTYVDNRRGINFKAEVTSFLVVDDAANKVQFNGFARIRFRGSDEALKLAEDYNIPVQFVVTVQDNSNTSTDRFSISINLDRVLNRTGELSRGDIQVHRQ